MVTSMKMAIEAIVLDLHQIVEYVQKCYPNIPYYLFGHGIGNVQLHVNLLQEYDDEIDGLILCGPPTENKRVWFGKFLVGN